MPHEVNAEEGEESMEMINIFDMDVPPPDVPGAPFTREEDELIKETVMKSDKKPFSDWEGLAQQMPGRKWKRVRSRWFNNLNPEIDRSPFNEDDDRRLLEAFEVLGSKWSEISVEYFKGTRSEYQLKNRYYNANFKKQYNKDRCPDSRTKAKSRSPEGRTRVKKRSPDGRTKAKKRSLDGRAKAKSQSPNRKSDKTNAKDQSPDGPSNLNASCDRCRSRKTKCDGKIPCHHCKEKYMKEHELTNIDGVLNMEAFGCVYSETKRRGPTPSGVKKGGTKKKASPKKQSLTITNTQEPWFILVTAPPGQLGLTLRIEPLGGATITNIAPSKCSFAALLSIGDRIITVDGKKVKTLKDITANVQKHRKLEIEKGRAEKNMESRPISYPTMPYRPPITPYFAKNTAAGMDAFMAYFSNMTAALKGSMPPALKGSMPPVHVPTPSQSSHDNNPSLDGATSAGRKQYEDGSVQTKSPKTKKDRKFPNLSSLGAIGDDEEAEQKRRELLTELLQYDKKEDKNTIAKMGPGYYQVVCVPLHRKERASNRTRDRETVNNENFLAYNQQLKVMDKFISGWASYCKGTEYDAINMILFYFARQNPQNYVKTLEKMKSKGGPADLTTDFVSHDGTNDIRWNTRYSELLKFKEENGHCKPNTKKTSLGKWVLNLRDARKRAAPGAKLLTPKRIQLLDDIGFLWNGLPEGQPPAIRGGDPRQNRAIAAKLVYPNLTIRECLLLGGFDEEELNIVRDKKHTWRTNYAYHKDVIVVKIKNFDTSLKMWARPNIQKMVSILEGEDEDRFDQVFGESSHLLPVFLEESNERMESGVYEKPLRPEGKREHQEIMDPVYDSDDNVNGGDDDDDDGNGGDDDEDEEQPARKLARLEEPEMDSFENYN